MNDIAVVIVVVPVPVPVLVIYAMIWMPSNWKRKIWKHPANVVWGRCGSARMVLRSLLECACQCCSADSVSKVTKEVIVAIVVIQVIVH